MQDRIVIYQPELLAVSIENRFYKCAPNFTTRCSVQRTSTARGAMRVVARLGCCSPISTKLELGFGARSRRNKQRNKAEQATKHRLTILMQLGGVIRCGVTLLDSGEIGNSEAKKTSRVVTSGAIRGM